MKQTIYVFLLTAITLLSFTASNAIAQAIGMVTGPTTGTYIALGDDIAKLAEEVGIKINVKSSNGSIDNLRRITEKGENAGIGIVQSDVLGVLKRSNNPRSKALAKKLRMIFPLYPEEVHILASKEIKKFSDLQGKRVVIGQEGSGNMITSMNLFAITNIKPSEMLQIAPPEGVVAVLAGEADATIFIGGKPVKLFENIENIRTVQDGKNAHLLDQVHFIPVRHPEILKEYDPTTITKEDYGFVTNDIPTVAVTSILVSYDFSPEINDYYKTRCKQLEKIGNAVRNNLSKLRAQGHPKWNEVNPHQAVAMWQRDDCAWRNSEVTSSTQNAKPNIGSALERDLLQIIEQNDRNKQ